ncbi:hypothetical protein DACRYDRAFT_113147 [Dacryopinax primogenitus]|uniref:Uncharacterized protein n=1 Tax=Dacryopinax primogenitus (strain DJM 731) TaxID=1858805 RepID=M5GFM0_DACPD|nr:uncharacterized protein DACRYDRAFT_113147 [Dacryopinax primogenitus]EJU06437.1 hypothetical protein DACRYDRAFT_113147 [Dacryopinax primogenitus]
MVAPPPAAPVPDWTPTTPFPLLPALSHPSSPSPFLTSPSPPALAASPNPSTSLPAPSTSPTPVTPGPPSLMPLLDFYGRAREWTAAARLSLEPSPPPSPPRAVMRPKKVRRRGRPYPPQPSIIIKAEPEEVSLHAAVVTPPAGLGLPMAPPSMRALEGELVAGTVVQEEDARLQRLLGDYERMLWERVESCERIERLIEDSARMFADR